MEEGRGRSRERCANFWLSVRVTEGAVAEVELWEEPQVNKVLVDLKSH